MPLNTLKVSKLNHTWIFDIDGTILKHNDYLLGNDKLLPGIKEFWKKISIKDTIIILTARDKKYRKKTIKFLNENKLRFNHIIFGLPYGERFLFNDIKPSGLKTAVAINLKRNKGLKNLKINKDNKK